MTLKVDGVTITKVTVDGVEQDTVNIDGVEVFTLTAPAVVDLSGIPNLISDFAQGVETPTRVIILVQIKRTINTKAQQ